MIPNLNRCAERRHELEYTSQPVKARFWPLLDPFSVRHSSKPKLFKAIFSSKFFKPQLFPQGRGERRAPETRDLRPETRDPNPRPETPTPKPQNGPQTLNPKSSESRGAGSAEGDEIPRRGETLRETTLREMSLDEV